MLSTGVIGMAKGMTGREPDPRIVYADIIDLPHWQSPTRPHMSLYDRSAQFASYKALSGYEDMVLEEARLTDAEAELSDGELERINQKLNLLMDVLEDGEHPVLTFTVFVPDERKAGGSYEEITDAVKHMDPVGRKVVLASVSGAGRMNRTIDFDRIAAIHGDLVDYMDEML